MDVRARRLFERPKLETGSHRSRTMNGSRWFAYAGCVGLAGTAIGVLAGAGMALAAADHGPFRISNTQLEPVTWSEINGWNADDHAAAFSTFLNSCKAIVRGTPSNRVG